MKFWLFFIAVQILFLIWIIVGVHSAPACAPDAYAQACQSGQQVGSAIGAGLVGVLWFFVDVILLIIKVVTLLSSRRRQNNN